ncbi:transposase [Brevibacillus sp. 7WMA2]|uniref:transposase n=1 Tax=Brevibacillus TaxID=55080 RepID=UPI0013A7144C|nr:MULTISPECIES: transposase [Brevibacillus]MCR8993839.1 transposase [Brevibacillus laterosporus]QIC04890.1 transposase [Brevibacillus sp. 7WMA2]WPS90037.1 transposase [Brevibacillus halotolerans]
MGKIRKTYSKDFKLKAVQLYLSGEQGYKTLTRDLGISDPSILRGWVDHYGKEGIQGLDEKRGRTKNPLRGKPLTRPESMEEEIVRLRAENEF